MMYESEYSISLSLIISNCDMQSIPNVLSKKPTQVLFKGKKALKCLPPSDKDVWVYTKMYPQEQPLECILADFITDCELDENRVNAIQKVGNCCIRLSIQSDYAQIGLRVSSDSLRLLVQTGIDLEVSIFSWGNVIDDD